MSANPRASRLLDGLSPAQVTAVTTAVTENGPVVVLAGAGSGKTRVLTRRLAHQVLTGAADPSRILTLTFTRKAASELHQRIRALGLRDPILAGTFHGLALQQLRQRWEGRGITPPTLLTRRTRLIRQLLHRDETDLIVDVLHEIDWARARLIEPGQYPAAAAAAGRRPPLASPRFKEVMTGFQQEKRRRRVVDFDDLLMLAYRDLKADPDYAAAVRWQHRHFYVDEFQDVNPLQFALLSEWLGGRNDLFVVGDPNQAIYGWNGADPDLLNTMAEDPSATVVRLEANYRSSPQVLQLANSILTSGRSDTKGTSLVAQRPAGPLPCLLRHATDKDEAAYIASAVRSIKAADRPWSDQAILVRTNAQLVVIEQALGELGIPCRIKGGLGPLASPEVKEELKQLSTGGVALVSYLEELDERLASPTTDGPTSGIDRSQPRTGADAERHQNLLAFAALVHEYVSSHRLTTTPTGPGLVAWIDTLGDGDVSQSTDAVELATFHGAKGLEWPVVHLAGLEDGFVPISYATTIAQRAEEQRLLYVAVTRAEQQLHLNWAAKRTFGLSEINREPSPYIAALEATINDLRGSEAKPADWRSHIARSRQRLPSTSDTEPKGSGRPTATGADDLHEALQRWRSTKAKAAGVPQHVILDDRSLQSVSDHRPTNLAALASTAGIRPVKLARYGDDLLRLVAESEAARRT